MHCHALSRTVAHWLAVCWCHRSLARCLSLFCSSRRSESCRGSTQLTVSSQSISQFLSHPSSFTVTVSVSVSHVTHCQQLSFVRCRRHLPSAICHLPAFTHCSRGEVTCVHDEALSPAVSLIVPPIVDCYLCVAYLRPRDFWSLLGLRFGLRNIVRRVCA